MKVKPTDGSYQKASILIDTELTTRKTKFKNNALSEVASYITNNSLPLMLSHNTDNLPSGRWYDASVNEQNQVVAKFFIPQEIPEYSDIKSRIDTGLLDSSSIGFSADIHECSICNNSINDYANCEHIPGKEYAGKECYVLLDGIHPQEASLVYSGAVPSAKIQPGSADEYSAYESKKDFCDKFSFDSGQLEIVNTGKILQDTVQNNHKGSSMALQEKFDSLQDNYSDLAAKYANLNKDKLDLEGKVSTYKSDLTKLEEYKVTADEATSAKDEAVANAETYKAGLTDAVTKLALPFEAEYKAPEDVKALLTDLETYIEKAKALPVGRQSNDGEETIAFAVNDEIYRSN